MDKRSAIRVLKRLRDAYRIQESNRIGLIPKEPSDELRAINYTISTLERSREKKK